MTAVDLDQLETALMGGVPLRTAYPSRPWVEQNNVTPELVEAVWSDGARMVWIECDLPEEAAAIVAAVNAASALVAELRDLRAVLGDLTEAVGRGDEVGLPEAYRAACSRLKAGS